MAAAWRVPPAPARCACGRRLRRLLAMHNSITVLLGWMAWLARAVCVSMNNGLHALRRSAPLRLCVPLHKI